MVYAVLFQLGNAVQNGGKKMKDLSRQVRRALSFILLIAVCLPAGTGCNGAGARKERIERDRIAVEHTVLRYTQRLAEGYAKMNMTNLQEVATLEQAKKVYKHMSALGDAKIRMESELVDIEFLDIQVVEPGSAEVKTREKWNYTQVNTDTKMPSRPPVTGLIYTLSYKLVRQDDRWLVSSVSTVEERDASSRSTSEKH